MFDFMAVTKALADTNRVRILRALDGRELCVCQVIEMLKLAPSTVSKHLAILRQARLVDDRKNGRWMYYRRPDQPSETVRNALAMLDAALSSEEQIEADRTCVEQILCIERKALCRSQARK